MPSRKRLAAALSLGVAFTGLQLVSAPSATAVSTGLVISEVYGGGGNAGSTWKSDFIELHNPTSAAISVAGWSVQGRSAGSGDPAAVTPLTGSVPAGGYYLVKQANGNGGTADLPEPDAEGTLAMGAGGWQVWLSTGTAPLDPQSGDVNAVTAGLGIIDFVGGATNAASFETAPVGSAPSATLSIQRDGADTDSNAADFDTAAPTPTNTSGETLPLFAATDPGDQTVFVGTPASITLTAMGGVAPYTWAAEGLPAGLALAGNEITGTPTTVGNHTVTVTATDSTTPTPRTDGETFVITVEGAPELRTIAEIQGTGPASPLVGTTVVAEGVVTGLYPTGGLDGLFIQTPGPDATSGASDGLFVYAGQGAVNLPAGIALGDSVRVTGRISEFNGSTQSTPGAGGIVELETPLPDADPRAIAYPATEAGREAHEGELLAPTNRFTVTNVYDTNTFAEIGLATGSTPLVQPTEVYRDDDPRLATVKAANARRKVVLDDGSSTNYFSNAAAKNLPLPWLSPDNPIRVGAEATLEAPVVLEYRFGAWKFQPTEQVTDEGADVATFEDTRPANALPADVGGEIKLATFNVLNYFNTTGEQYVANGAAQTPPVNTACTYYPDREGNRIGNNRCGVVTNGTNNGAGPRGAATAESLARQQAKIVTAINTLDADIVALEEIENSMKLVGETNRDDALTALVDALNAAPGAGPWKFVHSPGEALTSGAIGEQDVIRSAYIYKPAKVRPVGQSDILFGTSEFTNAREPLAQAFKPTGALDSTAFAVVANHFKSKGDSDPPATGDNANSDDTGAFNGDRTRQAARLLEFAGDFAEARGTDAVFLVGDFNSYTEEDPMHVLYDGGFDVIETEGDNESYSFSGLSGSVDHVLGNPAAMDMVTGSDVWDINASESVAFQYSRFNYNATQFFDAGNPFAASDHNPEIVGIDLPAYGTDYTPIQILATNDFHGRLLADGANAAGAAVLSGAVKELRSDNPDTVFSAAGDLIGASTFESFIQRDEPTIDALNEAGLEVSAAGNHEFDAGYADLLGRVQDSADWAYIAANVDGPESSDELAETWTKDFGDITVGFVGAVTEDLPSLVSPDLNEGVTVTDIVEATNRAADELKDEEDADLVVLLVHEGSPSTGCATMTNPATAWGAIVTGVDEDVDAIVSGHTHLAYNCSFPVAEWSDRAVKERPVVSAGQYGTNLNQLVFTFDNGTGELVEKAQEIVNLTGTGYAADPAVVTIVDDAKAFADVAGNEVLGQLDGPFNRAKFANGSTENRGGESTLNNLVAEVQRAQTPATVGSADIAFMNPGGLRADMVGVDDGDFPRDLTFRQAANVQPFANTLVNMDLTGAQIETVLEQQWQRTSAGAVPSRAFLRLGVSEGFTYTYSQRDDPANAGQKLGEVTGMWLDGEAIDPAASYSVTANSFLASGGDNFRELANGSTKQDTGVTDLQAMVDYMERESPVAVDYAQRAVGVTFPASAPATYAAGDHVRLDVSSLAMTAPGDVTDAEIQVRLGNTVLGSSPVDNTVSASPDGSANSNDDAGRASVDVVLPAGTPNGTTTLVLAGATTGTQVQVPVEVKNGSDPGTPTQLPSTVSAGDVSMTYGKAATVKVTVTNGATGPVQVLSGAQVLGTGTVSNGAAGVTLAARTLLPGTRTLTVRYLGDATYQPAQGTLTATVAKAAARIKVDVSPDVVKVEKGRATVKIRVTADGVQPTGRVVVQLPGGIKVKATLEDGRAKVLLPTFNRPGKKKLTITYNGSVLVASENVKDKIRVVRR